MFNSLVGTQTPTYKLWNFSGLTSSNNTAKIGLEDDCPSVNYILMGTGNLSVTLPTNPAPGKIIRIINNYNVSYSGAIGVVSVYDQMSVANSYLVASLGSGQNITLMYAPDAVIYNSTATGSSKWVSLDGATYPISSAVGMTGSTVLSGGGNSLRNSRYYSVIAGGQGNYNGGNRSIVGAGNLNNLTGDLSGILAGDSNAATSNYATIGGGSGNTASSIYTFIGAGIGNTASGVASVVCGGQNNLSQSTNSTIAGGIGNTIGSLLGGVTIVGGGYNTANGNYAFVGGGEGNTSNSQHSSVLGGYYNTANAQYSSALGARSVARTAYGTVAFAACYDPFGGGGNGFIQSEFLHVGRETSTNTPIVATSNSSTTPADTNQLYLPNNSAYFVEGSAVAIDSAGTAKQWTFTVLIKRTGGTVAIVGSPVVTSTYADAAAALWAIALSADTTNNCLQVTVTGDATNVTHFSVKMTTTEVVN